MIVSRIFDGAFHCRVETDNCHNLTGNVEITLARVPGEPSLDDTRLTMTASQALHLVEVIKRLVEAIDEDRVERFKREQRDLFFKDGLQALMLARAPIGNVEEDAREHAKDDIPAGIMAEAEAEELRLKGIFAERQALRNEEEDRRIQDELDDRDMSSWLAISRGTTLFDALMEDEEQRRLIAEALIAGRINFY